tara:strand:+ start:110 stop:628 length:519 start_codon:yes stop_codon:yes gene_type:complete
MKSNLVKILGTLGLIIAIAVILKSVFGIGNIGIKSIFNKVSSSKNLPILKCEIYDTDGSKRIEFYDLEKIKKNNPTEGMTTDQFQKWRNQQNLEATTFADNESMNQYTIGFRNHENGVVKGYSIRIEKDTGILEARFPKHYPVEATFSKVLDAVAEGQVFKGECVVVKRKNL